MLLLILTSMVSTPARTFAASSTFTNTREIVITDNGPSSRYPSWITVDGVTDMVATAEVTLSGLSHNYPDDIRVLLVNPSGKKVVLMADAGGGDPILTIAPVNLTFSSIASAPLGNDVIPVTGSYQPSIFTSNLTFPSLAPAAPYTTSLESLVGTSPNGSWRLYVADGYAGFTGTIANGWSLTLTTSADADNDGVPNATDTCPGVANVNQADANSDGIGDACENVAPVLDPIANQTMPAGDSLSLDIVAADANSNLVRLSASNLPSFASLTSTGSGVSVLRLAPSAAQTGTYSNITITASDDALTATTSFTLTVVTPNATPVIAKINNQTMTEGTTRTITVSATDADGDALALSATGLPAFASFSDVGNGTGKLTLAPNAGSAGVYSNLTISAADAFTTTSQALSVTVNSSTTIKVPSSGSGNPYPSTIAVSGIEQVIADLTVTLRNVTRTNPDDLDILLVGPRGESIMMMSDAGGSNSASNVTLTFDDDSAALADSTALVAGSYQPTSWAPAEGFPLPAPSSPSGTTLATSDGTNPNGDWRLFVRDDASGNSGTIGGWSLEIVPAIPPVLNPIGDRIITAGVTSTIQVTASDTPGDTITLSAENLASFATFVDHGDGTGTLNASPASDQFGTFGTITITASDGIVADSETFSLTTVDGTAPTTTPAWSSEPLASGWYLQNVTLTLAAADSGSGVASTSYAMSGAQTVAETTVATDTRTVTVSTNGITTITWFATDEAGNTEVTQTATVRLDKVAPSVTGVPTADFVTPSTASSASVVPVRLNWSASDNTNGSGISRYGVELSSDNGATWIVAARPTIASVTLELNVTATYIVRVRAYDVAGRTGGYATGGAFTVRMRPENGYGVTYIGTWTTTASSEAYGGSGRYADSSTAQVSLSFTGTHVAWVSATCPECGKASVYVDNVFVTTVDLYSATLDARKVVFSQSFAGSGSHTLEIRVLGQKNAAASSTDVPIDAFLLIP